MSGELNIRSRLAGVASGAVLALALTGARAADGTITFTGAVTGNSCTMQVGTDQARPGTVFVPARGVPPTSLCVAWRADDLRPAVLAFAKVAASVAAGSGAAGAGVAGADAAGAGAAGAGVADAAGDEA